MNIAEKPKESLLDFAPSPHEIETLLFLFDQGRHADAEAIARTLTIRFPLHGLSWLVWGEVLVNMGRFADALAPIQKATSLLSDKPEVHNTLGLTFRFLNRLDEAEASFRHALQLRSTYVDAHNNLGTTLRDRGRLDMAEASFRRTLQIQHDYIEAHYNLGITLGDLGRRDEAAASYQRAIELKPDYVEAHINLGNTLRALGRKEEAKHCYLAALQFNPQHAHAHFNLGVTLRDLGRLHEAEASYRQALRINPNYVVAHNNLAIVFRELGRLVEAEASCRRALQIQPDYIDARNNLGIIFREQGHLKESEACHRQAMKARPEDAETYNNLGVTLHDQGRLAEAETCYLLAIKLVPDLAQAHNNLGVTLYDQGRLGEAEASYSRAIEINPGFSDAHSNLGSTLMALGKIGPAEESLSRAMELAPDDVRALSTALLYIDYRQDDPRFRQLESAFAERHLLPTDLRIRLDFAMGKAMENVGRYDSAFQAYEEGNRLHYQAHPFDESNHERFLENACKLFSSDLFKEFAELANLSPDTQDERVPIFIVGMPRSGTTLIEQILASHPAVFGAGELTALGEVARKAETLSFAAADRPATLSALRQLGREYLDQVWKLAPNAAFIVDKMPANYFHLGLIHLMLPNAKIIHSMRDPIDTCFSCYALRFTMGYDYSYDLGALGRTYLRYRQLLAHWRQVLPPGRLLDLRYEDNVADPEREARRLLNYLGQVWDPACLRFFESERTVKTASITQVRKPIYASSVARWKHFERHLGPLLEAIHPHGDFDSQQ